MANFRWKRFFSMALAGYVVLLFAAGWPAPIRPVWFDRPHALARQVLGAAGLRPGHEVFKITRRVDHTTAAHCFHVRGRDDQGALVDLWPPDGKCAEGGLRFHFPARDLVHTRVLEYALVQRDIVHDPPIENSISAIVNSFCWRGDGQPPFRTVALAWHRFVRFYEDGRRVRVPVLHYVWECRPERRLAFVWDPKEPALRPYWNVAP